jgi:hypothetical protein
MARNNRAKVKKEDKKIVLTKREFDKKKEECRAEGRKEGVSILGRLAVAVMAENHNLTEDEIFQDMKDITRWSYCIDKHILAINEVDEICKRKGGVDFEGF